MSFKLISGWLLMALGLALAADRFEDAGAILQPRMGHTATLLPDGRVFLDGGAIGNPYWRHCMECSIEAELYDPATGLVEKVGGLRPSRKYHTATLMADGRVLIAGGWMGRGSFKTAEIFDPATKNFTPVGDMSIERSRHSAHLLKDGRVLIFGTESSIDVFDPDARTFNPIPVTGFPGDYKRALMMEDDQLLFTGGFTFSAGIFRTNGTIRPVAFGRPMVGMEDHTMTLLPNQSVLIAGGNEEMCGWDYQFSSNTTRTDLFDLSKLGAHAGPNLLWPRSHHSATLLMDGRVLIAGGVGKDTAAHSSTEVFDISSERILAGPTMSVPRSEHSATLLQDGRVLVAGGFPGGAFASAEMFLSDAVPTPLEILTLDGKGAVFNAGSGELVSNARPVWVGHVVEIYARGLVGGKIKPKVSIGGTLAEILHIGPAPGLAGVQQINVRIPELPSTGWDVPIWLMDLDRPSQVVKIGVIE